MKKAIYIYTRALAIAAPLLSLSLPLPAQGLVLQRMTAGSDKTACGVPVSGVKLHKSGDLMGIGLNLALSEYELEGDRASVFIPVLKNGADSLELEPVGVYGRFRYIQYQRAGEKALSGDKESSYLYSERPESVKYDKTVPYAEWMNGASLYLRRVDYGCCGAVTYDCRESLADWKTFSYAPEYRYVSPVAESEKLRELSGSAFIDFPVNRTEIRPDYRGNRAELSKITATIDSVRNDADVTVRLISIKGYASPEGRYDNNVRLAKGRTEALKQYVCELYSFDKDFISTDFEAEDWDGLRRYVDASGLEHRQEILAIIDDGSLTPDARDNKIRQKYQEEYKFLLQNVYPALRHSDYRIEYTIRQFSDTEEIRRTLYAAPQKLSLNEMYVLAQSVPAGSGEFNDIFETAVRMYPGDETANLNAANAAMQRNDLPAAEKYLSRAGSSAEAEYARGVYAMLAGDYAKAAELIRASGLSGTDTVLGYLAEAAAASVVH